MSIRFVLAACIVGLVLILARSTRAQSDAIQSDTSDGVGELEADGKADAIPGMKSVEMEPIVGPGETRLLVKEVQTTLNQVLGGRRLNLPKKWTAEAVDGATIIRNIDDKIEIHVDPTWRVEGNQLILPSTRNFLLFGGKSSPLMADGIYGGKTFVAVLLFQEKMKLAPTGNIDALTLEKLKPLFSSNSILDLDQARPYWPFC